jgi:hypothetical protein
MYTPIWSFRTHNFKVLYSICPEPDLDLSWDDDGSTAKGIAAGELIAFQARVEVINRRTGCVLGAQYLGNCIYESAEAFISHRHPNPQYRNCSLNHDDVRFCSYFPDMVRDAIKEARKNHVKLRVAA